MAEEVLKVTRHPNYAVLTLNRPEKRNALNQPLIDALDQALRKFEGDREIRALLLRGEGASFCAGIDLKEVDETSGVHNPTSLESVFGRLERFPVPTIAAVQGAALAGGLELALHCDLRIASDNAKLGMTLGRVGLMVPYDFTRKLIEVCGSANTAWILYTADLLDAERGRHMNIVHDVVARREARRGDDCAGREDRRQRPALSARDEGDGPPMHERDLRRMARRHAPDGALRPRKQRRQRRRPRLPGKAQTSVEGAVVFSERG